MTRSPPLSSLQKRLLKVITRPMTFADIADIVGRKEDFSLGIALGQLVLAGRLYHAEPVKYASEAPVYSPTPIPRKFAFPKREEPLINEEESTDA